MQRFTSSRSGTLVLGGLAALVAGALLLIYVSQVPQGRKQPVGHGVGAGRQQADPAELERRRDRLAEVVLGRSALPKDQVKDGAITDPASISGKIAAHDIYPNQQLTTSDFTDAPTDAVTTKLTGNAAGDLDPARQRSRSDAVPAGR